MTEQSFDDILRDMKASRAGAVAMLSDRDAREKGPELPSEYHPIRKSAQDCPDVGKRIRTVAMAKACMDVASRPDSVASVNGSSTRPTLSSIRKSASEPTRPLMISSVEDIKKSLEQDWMEYNSFISNEE